MRGLTGDVSQLLVKAEKGHFSRFASLAQIVDLRLEALQQLGHLSLRLLFKKKMRTDYKITKIKKGEKKKKKKEKTIRVGRAVIQYSRCRRRRRRQFNGFRADIQLRPSPPSLPYPSSHVPKIASSSSSCLLIIFIKKRQQQEEKKKKKKREKKNDDEEKGETNPDRVLSFPPIHKRPVPTPPG